MVRNLSNLLALKIIWNPFLQEVPLMQPLLLEILQLFRTLKNCIVMAYHALNKMVAVYLNHI